MDALSVLIVDDEKITAFSLRDLLGRFGYDPTVAHNGEDALELVHRRHFDLVITDLVMPGIDGFALVKRIRQARHDMAVLILTAHGSYDIARKAQAMGADDYLIKPINADQLQMALTRTQEKRNLRTKVANLGRLVENRYSVTSIIGSSPLMQDVIEKIEHARSSRAPVLIRGESGTGKELVARAIYSSEVTGGGNFVTVNCCAISEGLIESELFGHTRGAFSGAVGDREGLFELADGGTIFLDEIGDISLQVQTKLLRILQEGELRRVGENRLRTVNVRIIAATNKNLEEAVKNNSFRQDLYYRLNVIPIELPSLRQRRSDLPELINHFLAKYKPADRNSPQLSDDALRALMDHDFPGNVRELENIIQRAISFAPGPVLESEQVRRYLTPMGGGNGSASSGGLPDGIQSYDAFRDHLDRVEKEFLLERLLRYRGNVTDAAKSLSLTRTALHNKMKRLGILSHQYRQTVETSEDG